MGRLPLQFAGKDVTFRIPYTMSGELDIGPNVSGLVFPDSMFSHQTDKTFEIHRVKIELTARGTPEGFTTPTVLEPQPTTLQKRIRLRFLDYAKNENMTKNATLVELLTARNTGAWDWEDPYTIVRSEGFQISIDSLDFPSVVFMDANLEPELVAVDFVRVEISFQGFLDIIGPPSEVR